MKTAIELIQEERKKQIAKGYTAEHDDTHIGEEIADCAALYALSNNAIDFINEQWGNDMHLHFWQFDINSYRPNPNNRIKQLTKAAAMLVAEIERIQRLEKTEID